MVVSLYAGVTAQHAREVRAARRALWDFVAVIDDLRCLVCAKRIPFEDYEIFESTSLCQLCSCVVNDA